MHILSDSNCHFKVLSHDCTVNFCYVCEVCPLTRQAGNNQTRFNNSPSTYCHYTALPIKYFTIRYHIYDTTAITLIDCCLKCYGRSTCFWQFKLPTSVTWTNCKTWYWPCQASKQKSMYMKFHFLWA